MLLFAMYTKCHNCHLGFSSILSMLLTLKMFKNQNFSNSQKNNNSKSTKTKNGVLTNILFFIIIIYK